MQNILKFYQGKKVHPDGFLLQDILSFSDKEIEQSHNFIQWLFPLKKPSLHVSNSPTITDEEIAEFRKDANLKSKMIGSFKRMLSFYGLQMIGERKIERSKNFESKSGWLYPSNHNYQRISRILKSLNLLGLGHLAGIFFEVLKEIYKEYKKYIGENTFKYWENSMRDFR